MKCCELNISGIRTYYISYYILLNLLIYLLYSSGDPPITYILVYHLFSVRNTFELWRMTRDHNHIYRNIQSYWFTVHYYSFIYMKCKTCGYHIPLTVVSKYICMFIYGKTHNNHIHILDIINNHIHILDVTNIYSYIIHTPRDIPIV